ncbi:hypothetical protein IVB33_11095 [Bradyrhizobium sp. 24]|uniref:hypothetical protein n=1 Tax=unclassified Bradyrhizobium TaxID=2631580 RepID=UPI001FF7C7CD|nr:MULTISPECIES: hypothetical protein [unclassified Bradyrhizobium]MCK1301967.1 hypothetical protein [Bradyrhizobium sp. 37]MCK1378570.1 hypothetical protein [Bradyrhizobium sp. 24]MCK1773452.1 hypothetical protein [Bradyrhizobium sp. 134]
MDEFGDFPESDEEWNEEMFRAIGSFIYSFSQLEITIRLRLSDALQLREGLFEVVVGPYDFATLCNVTREVLARTRSDLDAGVIKTLFNRCLALNQKARIVVAHGTWYPEGGGASHLSKNTFQSTNHFKDLSELHKFVAEAKHLMLHVIASTGWKHKLPEGMPVRPL